MIRPRPRSALEMALALAAVAIGAGASARAAHVPAPASPPPSSPSSSPPATSAPVPAPAPAATSAAPATTAGPAPSGTKPAAPPSSPASPASGVTFGVVGIGPASLPPTLATQLDSAAAAGLVASGATVVGRELTARPAGSCDGPTCLQQVARASGARYLLRGTCDVEGSTYRVHLDMIDGSTGAVALSRQDTCEICTEHDVVEATNIAASALKATFDRTVRTTVVATYPTPAVDLRSDRDRADRGPPLWLRAAPWVAFAAAAGAIGAGVYLLAINGEQAPCDGKFADGTTGCTKLYSTNLRGGLALGAGAVVGALGVLALTLTPSAPSPAATTNRGPAGPPHAGLLPPPAGVTLSPSGISAWTRF